MSLEAVETSMPQAHAAGVAGHFRADMTPLVQAFSDNFTKRTELGASLFVSIEGKVIADLWGGQTAKDGPQWGRDTICVIFSCTKTATALCLHLLAARGEVDLDAPVARYWPEFAAAGKQDVTLRMALDHSAGLPAIRAPLKSDCLTDWDYMVHHLEQEAPFWAPGSRVGYHALTFGFLVGEVVRRVSGRSLGQFFREEVATPLGIDFAIGLPEADEPRVAPIEPFRAAKDAPDTRFVTAAKERGSVANL
ncbi:MAG: serine hydrolase domain-containing protein, partial [Gemmobacter sp.]|nr:serine hydrolase domain-containing protein [Gemmobacter sp.]